MQTYDKMSCYDPNPPKPNEDPPHHNEPIPHYDPPTPQKPSPPRLPSPHPPTPIDPNIRMAEGGMMIIPSHDQNYHCDSNQFIIPPDY